MFKSQMNGEFIGVPVQFEGVGAVSVCGFLLQVAGQVDNRQSSERTFLQRQETSSEQLKTKLQIILVV